MRGGYSKPLLLILQGLLALGFISLLSACSIQPESSPFSASGFVADNGIIRLWRLNDQNSKPQVIMSVYSPYHNKNTTVTFYEYRHGNLWQIRRNVLGHSLNDKMPIAETLRIDQNNVVIFKLRQLKDRNELLSDNDVKSLQLDAKQILETSDALIAKNIMLLQGHWQNSRVTTCAGKQLFIEFNPDAQRWLKERQSNSSGPLTIAWLDSSEGKQLLLVANDDFCRWEPTKDKL
ncbi:DUF1481 domain-containing protein [Xenorhabdus nematophila]|nr:DUF1481 domain-containing protein [Xenorhabdus nematophila]AYA41231.1 DUF1481 domain-containing protein [Xenorhabdus nematophila]KHD27326.1 hypothetical protein LH67_19140 [Xenorhabdus nematophila]MCB4426375.1 DUF1481 domain-containing protein [Xenorhabdus nematophila]CEF33224.1 conserved hypothetical protein; putative exported protein [Xenorhabdus nematophila str. Websteri]